MLILLISFFGIGYYINNNKAEYIAKIEKVLNENRKGAILFDSISVSSLWNFPNINIKIYNLKLIDSLYKIHQRETVFMEEVSTTISIIDAFNEELKITDISAKKGSISIFVDDDHYTNTYVFKANSKYKKNSIKIISNDIDIIIEDLEFTFTEKIKNKRVTAHINNIDFNIDAEKMLIPTVNLDVFIKEMGLNLEKGTFFNNARCVGSFQPKINLELHTIEVPEFILKIKSQSFNVAASINTKTKLFTFLLDLDNVNFKETKQLLPTNLKTKLDGYEIVKPFDVSAKISGKFEFKDLTKVELQYKTFNNEIVYKKDSLHLKNVSFNGSFINRIFKDSSKIEHRKNYLNTFTVFQGEFDSIPFKLTDVTLINEYSKPLYLKTNYEAQGEIKKLDNLINSHDYTLTNGNFQLKGNYNGTITNLADILKSSETKISIHNFIIKGKKNRSRFVIPVLELDVNHNVAKIKKLFVDLDKKNRLQLSGFVNNFSNLIGKIDIENPTLSSFVISSKYLDFSSLLKTFGSQKKQTKSLNLTHVKAATDILLSKFNPTVSFSIQKLDFFDIPFSNIEVDGLYLNNIIIFKNISGNYKDGDAVSKINLDLRPKKGLENREILKFEISLKVNGKIEHWAEMLHNEKFFFQDAKYEMDLEFSDEASTIYEFINHSDITLNIGKGSMFYKPSDLSLPFHKISVSIKNKNAFLNDFELTLPNNQSLHLKGNINNFVNLFDEKIADKSITSTIMIFSEDLNFSNFIDAFNPNAKKPTQKNNIKSILNDLYKNFKPTVHLDLEKLSYKSVTLEKVNASLLFKNINTLSIENAYCYFYDKKLSLTAEIDISQNTLTAFKTGFNLDNFAIEHLLYSFNNFGYRKLDKPTELTGIINLKANFNGIIDDENGVKFESLNANLTYNIKELELKNFQPIIDAGNKVFRKKRFETIKFANVKNTLNFKGNLITIPETSIQSTALDFFIEGVLDNSSNTDLWVSIPLSNLKRRDLTTAPSKKSFEEAGKKIYLEITSDSEGKLEHKIHLRNKRFLKNRTN